MKKAAYILSITAMLGCYVPEDASSSSAVRIFPEQPTTEDNLECYVNESSATFDYYWYEGTKLIQKDLNRISSFLGSSYTEEDKTYLCSVFLPETGLTDSYYIGENEVYIQE